ncbi:MAG: hypothetical protein A2Y38_14375 [Spirochaetes bacterium GWB1_59_5]|nr:MAG: hypothetical protein A2Y38_14375 [Spirochaetes bacterium GWB1_59_5]
MKTRRATAAQRRAALKGAVLGLFGAALVAVMASAAVWPLWYLATSHTGIYTVLVVVAMIGGLAYLVIVKIKRRKAESVNASIGS